MKKKTIVINKGQKKSPVGRPAVTTRLVRVPGEHVSSISGGDRMPTDSPFPLTPTVARHRGVISHSAEYTLLQNMYDGVVLADTRGRILDVNARAGRILHGSPEQLRQMSVLALIDGAGEGFLRQMLELTADCRHVLLDAVCVRLDGEEFPAEIAATTLNIGGRSQICFFIRDISERKRLEAELSSAQVRLARVDRLEANCLLAGQIAHDLNNLIAPMLAYPELLKDEVRPDGKGAEYIGELEKCARQVSEVTRGLLDLSRQAKARRTNLDIGAVCGDFVRRYAKGAGNSLLSVEWRPSPEPLLVFGNEAQIARVLSNLCANASDAMPRGGTMTVAVKRVDLAEAGGRYVVVPAGFYAAISVSDTGCGIPEAIHDRIFDPFFTTKSGWRTSAGSGLGLSIVYSIVKDLDGFTDFETTEGKGSTFTVYLPLAAVSVASAEKAGS